MTSFLRKLTWWRERRRKEQQLREELEFHLAQEAEERQAGGLPADQARRAARRDLGNVTLVQEDTRTLWTWMLLEQLGQDVRYALRMMAKNRVFTSLAVLSLALGIGANTAIFSFMDSILLRSLPVPDPQDLVMLSWRTPRQTFHGSNRHDESYADPSGYVGGIFSYPAFELLRKSDAVFTHVFGYQAAGPLNLTVRGQAEMAETEYVSGEYFAGLGTPPAAGRLIAPDDDRTGAPNVAVISFALSQKRFGGPGSASGQAISINNLPFTVIGVTPPGFFGADPDKLPQIYVPLHSTLLQAGWPNEPPETLYLDRGYDWIVPMARLRPGVSAAQAQAALSGPFLEWGRTVNPKTPAANIPTLVVREGARGLDGLRRTYAKPLYLLLALVGLILTTACANIANLLLARATARRREIAVRLSIGASRRRVIRQLLTESVVLATTGGALGVAFAVWGIRFLTVLLANGRENFTLRADLNWNVLGVTAAVSLLTGVLFGLAPALQSTRLDLVPALKASRPGEARGRRSRHLSLSRLLMVSQVAITMLILVAAGLFARTLSNLASIEPGFNRDNVLTFRLDARQAGHTDTEIVPFYEELRRQFSAIPGVRGATLSARSLIGEGTSATGVSVSGVKPKDSSRILTIGPAFFTTMQIPVLLGREITERDRPGVPMVAVVNQEFARINFGDRNPLGQHLGLPRKCPACDIEVVGVTANVHYGSIKRSVEPTVFLSFAQGAWGPVQGMVYELRTEGNPLASVSAVRELVRRADERLPVSAVKTQRAWIDQTINQEITFARLCSAFALLALTIACVGLYGTMSYNVARRTSEIGVRMALGARRASVIWMVLREVFMLAGFGLAVSVPIALNTSKVIESFLFGMQPNDPGTLAVAIAVLLSAALVAGLGPARRASRIDPMLALRSE
jgi:predicted permease